MLTSRGRKLQVRVVSLQSAQDIGTLKCYKPAHNPCVGVKGDVSSITQDVGRVILPPDIFGHMWLLDQTRLVLSEDRETRPREPAGDFVPHLIAKYTAVAERNSISEACDCGIFLLTKRSPRPPTRGEMYYAPYQPPPSVLSQVAESRASSSAMLFLRPMPSYSRRVWRNLVLLACWRGHSAPTR